MKYKIQRELYKKGNYFTAYEGFQEGLGKSVEIRVFGQTVTDQSQELARFQLEIKTLAILDHPNILRILDCGVGNGRLYYVTDLKQGRSFADLKRSGELNLDMEDWVEIFIDLAKALQYMHRKGVIHRGLDTASAFYAPESRFPYVADFSFTKNMKFDGLTARGVGHILPALKTPEILLGQTADERTDIFLLGCFMFELLGGKEPYPAETMLGASEERFRSMKVPGLGDLAPEVPPAMEEVVMKACAPMPGDRFPSDTDFIRALTEVRRQLKLPRRAAKVPSGRDIPRKTAKPAPPTPGPARADESAAEPPAGPVLPAAPSRTFPAPDRLVELLALMQERLGTRQGKIVAAGLALTLLALLVVILSLVF